MTASNASSTRLGRWAGRLAVAPRLAGRLLAWGAPRHAIVFGPRSLGDDLLCTAVLREARRRGEPRVMFTARPELFAGNGDPAALHPIDDHYLALLRRLGRPAVQPYYVRSDPQQPQRDLLPPRHIIAEMCRLAGLRGEVALRPYLALTAAEQAAAPRHPRLVAVHSTGLAAALPYPTKEWGADRFAAVTRRLAPDFHLVQLGAATDPLLPGVALDLRGRTTLREAAAVLAAARGFIGLEGFLVHLARAVDCPAVVIHGGRAPAGIFDYEANRNLYARPDCSPCGLRDGCPHGLACLAAITPEAVVAAAHELFAAPRAPLPVGLAHL